MRPWVVLHDRCRLGRLAAGGGAVDDPDDLTLESALEKLMSAQAGGKAKDPWKLLREAIATMNDILVSE